MQITIEIRAVPQSGRQAIVLDKSGKIKVFLKSAPEQGKANNELIKVLAERLGIARSAIDIIAGHTVRTKRIAFEGFSTINQIMTALGLDQGNQLTIS